MTLKTVIAALLAFFMAAACSSANGPRDVALHYVSAVDRGNPERAWSLLHPDARRTAVREEFAARVATHAGALGDWVSPEHTEVVREEARWVRAGDELTLRRRGARWVISQGLPVLYPNDAPGVALRSFLRALRHGRWDVVRALAPADRRGRSTPESVAARFAEEERAAALAARLPVLEGALRSGVEFSVSGEDRAVLQYGAYRAVLEREADGWHVRDL